MGQGSCRCRRGGVSTRGLIAATGIRGRGAKVSVMSVIQTVTSPKLLGQVSCARLGAVPRPLGRSEMGVAGRQAPPRSSATARSAVPKRIP